MKLELTTEYPTSTAQVLMGIEHRSTDLNRCSPCSEGSTMYLLTSREEDQVVVVASCKDAVPHNKTMLPRNRSIFAVQRANEGKRHTMSNRAYFLTAEEAEYQLAYPVYQVLCGKAFVSFSGMDVTAPSMLVQIQYTEGGLPSVWVNGEQYRKAILPILQDPQWEIGNPLMQLHSVNDKLNLIDRVGSELRRSFEAAGY